jgi:hypothetical protein
MPDYCTAKATIGQGDYFNCRKIASGIKFSPSGESCDLGGIMSVNEISSAIKSLAEEYGFSTFSTLYHTSEGSGGVDGAVESRTD